MSSRILSHPLAPSSNTRVGMSLLLMVQFWLIYALSETYGDAPAPRLLALYSVVTVGPVWIALSYSGLTRNAAAISGFFVSLLVLGLGWMTGAQCDAELDIRCGPVIGPYVLILTPIVLMSVVFLRAYAVDRIRAQRGDTAVSPYATLFFEAWHVGLALLHALFVMLAAWALLLIGGQLFRLIGIDVFHDLFREAWFAYLFTGLAYGAGLAVFLGHAATLVVVRNVILGAGGLLMPLAAVIVLTFVATAPFAETAALWELERPSAWLMAIALAVLGLYNCVFQDGGHVEPVAEQSGWQRVSALLYRASVVVLLPVMAIVAYGLTLRVQQYGWTAPRIYGAVLAGLISLMVVVYAVGFVLRAPVKSAQGVNALAAVLAIVIGLMLISPIARPSSLSALHQAHRIQTGATPPEEVDAYYLRYESGRVGYNQWQRLGALPLIADNAEVAKRWADPMRSMGDDGSPTPAVTFVKQHVRGNYAALPDALIQSPELRRAADGCDVNLCVLARVAVLTAGAELPGEFAGERGGYFALMALAGGKPRRALLTTLLFRQSESGVWIQDGWAEHVRLDSESRARAALEQVAIQGQFDVAPKQTADILLGGERIKTHVN